MQELLEFWLRIQRGNEPDMLRFQDNIRKVAVLTQDVKQITILLGVLVSEVCHVIVNVAKGRNPELRFLLVFDTM